MKNIFVSSYEEIKGKNAIFCLVTTAMLIGLSTVLEYFTIDIPFARINFAYIAIAAIGMLYGPCVSFFAGGICDVFGHIVHPQGAFLPVYTLIAAFQGLIYGLMLYRRWGYMSTLGKPGFANTATMGIRIVASRVLDVLIINLLCNTAANLHYGFIPAQAFDEAVVLRLTKNLLQLCADIPLLLILIPALLMAYERSIGKMERRKGAAKAS
ncbi:MAG: folate family ECF transporter S component [Oscillospiraceae bacterium]|mgnify:CR=1 FL=1|jgi:ECF transporter S component (folate family)|nr:folate family ECF transporter S component [Oscillospiraceae bacterium]MBR4345436.1 folate family ECF transporter S component [Oscillospiraceae bacterium]